MNLFDILGPVMVGPSSSHTAGAVRLGRTARRLLGEGTPREAAITLFGSFAATGHGHGTDRALIAGLLGFQPDDERIARSFDIARDAGMAFSFTLSRAGGEHLIAMLRDHRRLRCCLQICEALDEIHFREKQLERMDYLRYEIHAHEKENG